MKNLTFFTIQSFFTTILTRAHDLHLSLVKSQLVYYIFKVSWLFTFSKVRWLFTVLQSSNFLHSKSQLITKWYFVTKIILTYCEKKLFKWSRKTFEIRGWRPRICKNFEITRTIYSNSERSDQLLVTECFFNLFLELPHI